MLNSFSVKNYRGFRDLTIDRLTRVNIVAGMNNTGKTSLLEAILLMLEPSHEVMREILRARGLFGFDEHFSDLARGFFSGMTADGPIRLNTVFQGNVYGADEYAGEVHGETCVRLVDRVAMSKEEPKALESLFAETFIHDWRQGVLGRADNQIRRTMIEANCQNAK